MKEIFGFITLACVEYAPVGLVVLFAAYIAYKRLQRTKSVLQVLQPKGLTINLVQNVSFARACIKALLLLLGITFLWIALMRPQWNKKDEVVMQEGRDLLIAVDVSRSMLATDVAPNRLELTKQKVRTLVNSLASDRVGLLLFSGSAVVQCPLTNDYSAFFMFLDQVNVETISSGTTAIDAALRKALMVFKQGAKRKNNLLVLFTDGEDFSTNLSDVKRAAQEDNVTMFTLGVGTAQGSPIPLFDAQGKPAGHQKDRSGAVVISRLNDQLLQNLARETGGVYVPVDPINDTDIATLISRVSGYEKEKFDDKKMSQLEDQYPYFLTASFICFALEWLL